jgi:hypothetical protein
VEARPRSASAPQVPALVGMLSQWFLQLVAPSGSQISTAQLEFQLSGGWSLDYRCLGVVREVLVISCSSLLVSVCELLKTLVCCKNASDNFVWRL